jgi:glutaconate CoA-transferase, subunit B
MGLFSFDASTHEMTLTANHPGVSIQKIKNETGWPLRISPELQETAAPTDPELSAIRKYDPKAVWTS